jgi:RNA polymerase sigma-70 factor (ECF subfamily)
MTNTPNQETQIKLHQRVSKGDPSAFSELCVIALPYLEHRFRIHFRGEDWHDFVIDTLINYQQNPRKYDPEKKATLLNYLYMDARGDYLNHLEKMQRQPVLAPIFDVVGGAWEIADADVEDDDDDFDAPFGDYDLDTLIGFLGLESRDQSLLRLMVSGYQPRAVYADVLEITHLPIEQQRREIKRHKDRLRQWLKTNGRKKLHNE